MMKISEILNSQQRRTEDLVRQLEEHTATWAAVQEAHDALDKECVHLASRVSAAKLAQSDSAPQLELELRALRYRRLEIKSAYFRKREKITAELESINGPKIRAAIEDTLARMKALHPDFQRDETFYSIEGSKRVRVRHNSAAIRELKERALSAIDELRRMQHRALGDVEAKIREVKNLFNEGVDLYETDVMTPDTAREHERKPETPVLQNAWISDKATVIGQASEAGRIADLTNRVEKLSGGR